MRKSLAPEKAALLWDESFLWGLMSHRALRASGLSFDLLRCEDIRRGGLANYPMLFVPGGWASNKLKALGDEGVSEIRRFVAEGGSYLGFCGGAGLATHDGMGLLDVKRRPTKERVPSFSGRISLNCGEHPIWKGLPRAAGETEIYGSSLLTPETSPVFHAWWPSQFIVDGAGVDVLASYGKALPDAFSSDLNVGDTSANGSWAELEKIYGINLDPERLSGEPAVVEGIYGKGRVVLSLIHFDTPGDRDGQVVLQNLWGYMGGGASQEAADFAIKEPAGSVSSELSEVAGSLEARVDELISLGRRNFLWFWRNPMLLQWRRGVRGLEYCTLHVLVKEIARLVRTGLPAVSLRDRLERIGTLLDPFVDDAVRLLVMERLAMQHRHITYEKCENPEIREIRTRLFSNSKSHGGLFKELIDEIDGVLFSLLRQEPSSP